MRFEDLDLAPELMRGIEDAGFVTCTPIQEQSLPWTLEGDDLAGQAQTGTGKTAAFLLTAFSALLSSGKKARSGHARAICVAPTRELAIQIADDAMQLGKYTGLKISTIYGGVPFEKQRRDIEEGIDLLIGTPGRINDFLRRRELRLDMAEVGIVDEADRMFDMGFIQDIRFILHKLPPKGERQLLLFSATMNMSVATMGYQFMVEPREVTIEPEQVVVDKIETVLYHVGGHEKFQLLLGLLDDEDPDRAIIFCNRKVVVERVAERLRGNDYDAAAIIGDLPQNQRQKVIERFKDGDLRILVATDVASRGLHVDNITHVFNYDVPQDPEDYVHRIGRTARAGAEGKAITLACEDYVLQLPAVEKFVGAKITVGHLTDDMFAIDESPPPPRRPRSGGGRGGPRGGGRSGGGGHGGGGGGGGSRTRGRGRGGRR
ncbi:MAG: ATP-dependent RNA helicase RhlB [Myxococcota bacterium]|jgi:ATP-dependent RNA helicase RhlB